MAILRKLIWSEKAAIYIFCLIELLCLVSGLIDERTPPTSLYNGETKEGHKLQEFLEHCDSAAKKDQTCDLSKPEDFQRLHETKKSVTGLIDYYLSALRLFILSGLLVVIFLLMVHLTIVKHFDWRSLPIANLFFEKEQYQAKTHGVRYQQYIWMKYLVLQGNHRIFKSKDWASVNWYKYEKRSNEFDYKSIIIHNFKFLDKKNLTKHLVEEMEKEAAVAGEQVLHTGTHIE